MDKVDATDLNRIKNDIETLNKVHQIEILRIMKSNDVILTENKNGVFINLTNIESVIIDKLSKYLKYVSHQDTYLNKLENDKIVYKELFES
jgi:hypothetical protein